MLKNRTEQMRISNHIFTRSLSQIVTDLDYSTILAAVKETGSIQATPSKIFKNNFVLLVL